jgi:hypothetical protein
MLLSLLDSLHPEDSGQEISYAAVRVYEAGKFRILILMHPQIASKRTGHILRPRLFLGDKMPQ